ncbi:MAG: AAA family ATPase [Nitrospinae bacterium]|nr:AAA family ATPase [Nitrospinota bacterium]
MRCPRCEFDNPPTMRFCGECGTKLALLCPHCGAENQRTFKFCGQCGASLEAPQPTVSEEELRVLGFTADADRIHPPQESQLQPHTPGHLADKILQAKAALEGERKQVTVLFADIKGSTELIEGLDPEEAHVLLDQAIERMMEAVHRYEGTVNHVLGDGIMALFGAPVAHEDHAVRACYAALAMQEAIRRYTEEARHSRGIEVQIRVGLNSGEVVVRAIGNDLHMDYSAIGQTTHLAARMEQLATPGSIRLTAETLRLADGLVQVKPLGPIPVKGLSYPVEAFELLGAGPIRRRLQAAAANGLTRFVGRQTELESLNQALERSHAGHGQVVALMGEPGVGKSRLFWEFTHSHRTPGWLILATGSASYGKTTAYLPLIDLLKIYFQLEERDDARRIREKITGKLLTLDKGLEPTLPPFLSLLGVTVENPQWQTLDPSQRRQQILDAVKRLLLRESQVQPLLLVFEDLHWIDLQTQAFLDTLLDSLPTARVLLLVNYRPEYQHSWGSKTYYTQLRLDPLSPETSEELLHALLGDEPSLDPLKLALIDWTEGNPFFLEECVHTLIEIQVLAGERGSYRLVKDLPPIQMPATVQAVLAARIDRLPLEEKRLLQCAAVIGTEVPFPLLRAVAELPEDALRRALTHLQAAEFLYETRLFPELEYTFKHTLTHEVSYGSLLQERRRALHARIMAALENLAGDRLAEQVAHHAFQGETWEKAVAYLRQAGVKALERSTHREAAECFEQALVALQHLPESRETTEQAIDLRFDLRNALLPLGQLERIHEHLRQAEALSGSLDDQHRLGRVCAYMAHYFWQMGEHNQAIESGQRALAIAAALGDVDLQVVTNFYLGLAYHAQGEYRRALEFTKRNIEPLEADPSRQRFGMSGLLSVLSRTWLAWSLAELGDFGEGMSHGEEGVRVAEEASQPYSRIAAYFGVGLLYVRRGDFQKAIPRLERALAICETGNLPIWFPRVASVLGHAYALSGRAAEALPLLEQAVEKAASMGFMGSRSLRFLWLSEAYLLAGRIHEADEGARRALDLSRNSKERGCEAWTLRLLGEIAAHQDLPDVEKAEDHYRQALALAEMLGMRPLLAHCQLGLGSLYRQMGRLEQAHAELYAAIDLFRSLEMRFWLARAEAELAKAE